MLCHGCLFRNRVIEGADQVNSLVPRSGDHKLVQFFFFSFVALSLLLMYRVLGTEINKK